MKPPALTYNPLSWNQGLDITQSDQAKTFINQLSNYLAGFQKQVYSAPGIFVTPGFFNVLDYGADNTGTNDTTSAIQNAINSIPSGAVLFFPSGTYKVSSTITLSNPVTLSALSAINTCVIQTSSATADVFSLTSGNITFIGLSITTSVTRTAGYHINVTGLLSSVYLTNLYLSGWFSGINASFASGAIRDCSLAAPAGTSSIAIFVDNGGGATMDNVVCSSIAGVTAAAGLVIKKSNGVLVSQCQFYGFANCIDIVPTGAVITAECYFHQCYIDNLLQTGATQCIQVLAGASSSIFDVKFTDCWISGGTGTGCLLATTGGGSLDGVVFTGCDFNQNRQYGLAINDSGVTNVKVLNCFIDGNGAAGTFDGIVIGASVGHFSIIGNRIGNALRQVGNTGHAINFGGSNNNLIVTDNDLLGNTGGELLNAPATSATVVIANNI